MANTAQADVFKDHFMAKLEEFEKYYSWWFSSPRSGQYSVFIHYLLLYKLTARLLMSYENVVKASVLMSGLGYTRKSDRVDWPPRVTR